MNELTMLIAPVGALMIAGFLVWFTGRPAKSDKSQHPAE